MLEEVLLPQLLNHQTKDETAFWSIELTSRNWTIPSSPSSLTQQYAASDWRKTWAKVISSLRKISAMAAAGLPTLQRNGSARRYHCRNNKTKRHHNLVFSIAALQDYTSQHVSVCSIFCISLGRLIEMFSGRSSRTCCEKIINHNLDLRNNEKLFKGYLECKVHLKRLWVTGLNCWPR